MNDTSPVAEMNLSCGEPPSAKWVWKNAVEQHTFFRSEFGRVLGGGSVFGECVRGKRLERMCIKVRVT